MEVPKASIYFSGRLTQMEIPANAVPPSRDFTALADVRGRPMIFSIGTDSILRLIIEDRELKRRPINLSAGLGFYDNESAKTFAVKQDDEGMIYLAVSTEIRDAVTPGRLLILKPFSSAEAASFDKVKASQLIIPNKTSLGYVAERIFLGNKEAGQEFPLTAISYAQTIQGLEQEDIKRIDIADGMTSWSLTNDLRLPTQVDRTIDVAMGVIGRARGIFVLYEISGRSAILFTAFTRSFSTSIECPQGSQRIMTFPNHLGSDEIIIAGDRLFYVSQSQLGRSNAKVTTLADCAAFQGIRDLDFSQTVWDGDKKSMSIWAMSGDGSLSYLYIDSIKAMGESRTIRVVPEGKASFFSSYMDVSGNQSVVYASLSGEMNLLEQPKDTCMWDTTPLIYEDDASSKMISCYYCPISVSDNSTGLPIANATILVHGTCWMNVFAGDRTYFIKPSGTWIETDMAGEVNLMMPTDDIACSALTVTKVRTGQKPTTRADVTDHTTFSSLATSKAETIEESNSVADATKHRLSAGSQEIGLVKGDVIIDPTYYTMSMLGSLGSTEDLKAAKDAYGNPVFANNSISEDDLKAAGNALGNLKAQRERLLNPNMPGSQAAVGTVINARAFTQMPSAADIIFRPAAWIHYLEEKVEQVGDWVLQKLEDGWNFIVNVDGQMWRFVLDTVEAISKGIKWVWENVIKKPLNDLIDYLGFSLVRHVKDIARTKRLIASVLNSVIDLGVRKIDQLADKLDENMAGLEKEVSKALDIPAAKLQSVNLNDKKKAQDSKKKEPTPVDSAISWLKDRLVSAAKRQAKQAKPSTESKTLVQSVNNVGDSAWTILGNAFENLGDTMMKVLISILSIFASDKDESVSIGDLIQQALADLVIGIVVTTGKVVSDVIRLVATILAELRSILNTPVDELIFGSLMKDWLGIGLPSLLDIICFIVAVPATIIRKIASAGDSDKKKEIKGLPDNFSDKDIEDAFSGKLAKEKPATACAFAAMCYDIQVVIVPIMAIVDLGKIGYAAITAGNGFSGPPKMRTISGIGGFIINLLYVGASFPWDSSIPAYELRVALSAIGLGNAVAELLIHQFVVAPMKLKAAATIDFGCAAISLSLTPFISAAELDATEAEWIGKRSQSLTLTSFTAEAASTIGKFGTNGAVLAVEPVTILAAAGVGGMMKSISGLIKTGTYSETLEGNAFKVKESASRGK